MKNSIVLFLFILSTFGSSCGKKQKNRPADSANSTSEQLNENHTDSLIFKRFEHDLFSIDEHQLQNGLQQLRTKYGSFTELYFSRIVKLGDIDNPMFLKNLNGFIHDPDIRSVYQAVDSKFQNMSQVYERLEGAFNRYHQLYPDSVLPKIYTMLSGFSYNIVTADSVLAIGLDLYLGSDSRFYELLGFPKYKISQMQPERIVNDAVKGYLVSSWEMADPYRDLVTRMIYQGKILYLMSILLPEASEAEILGYTEQELAWCKANEAQIWSHFIDRKLFYSTDMNDQVAYLNDGPFTKGFPKEAPARIGVWLGLQLVNSYMKKGEGDIHQLMTENDARKIFNNSKYKPGRA